MPKEESTDKDDVRIKDYFTSFSGTTPFHGFVQLSDSENWLQQIFWIAMVVISVYYTIADLVTPIREYIEEITVSNAMVLRNESITYPQASVCIEFDTRAFDIGIPTDTTSIATFLAANHELIDAMFFTHSSIDRNLLHLLKHNLPYPSANFTQKSIRTAIFIAARMFVELTNAENVRLNTSFSPLAQEAYTFFARGDFPRLFQRTGFWLCSIVNIWALYFDHDQSLRSFLPVCENVKLFDSVLWLGAQPMVAKRAYLERAPDQFHYDELCIALDGDLLRFTTNATAQIFLTFNDKQLYSRASSYTYPDRKTIIFSDVIKTRNSTKQVRSFAGAPDVHFKFSGSRIGFYNRLSDSQSVSLRRQSTAFKLDLLGMFDQYERSYDPKCIADGDYSNCTRQLFANELFVKWCNCWPFSLSTLKHPESIPLCSDSGAGNFPLSMQPVCQDAITRWLSSNLSETYNRNVNCLPDCHETIMSVHKDIENAHAEAFVRQLLGEQGNESAIVNFRVSEFAYQQTVESPKVDQLFSDIGGILGLWTGGSIIAIVHVVVTIVEYCISKNVPGVSRKSRIFRVKIEDAFVRKDATRPAGGGMEVRELGVGAGDVLGLHDSGQKLLAEHVDRLERRLEELEKRSHSEVEQAAESDQERQAGS